MCFSHLGFLLDGLKEENETLTLLQSYNILVFYRVRREKQRLVTMS